MYMVKMAGTVPRVLVIKRNLEFCGLHETQLNAKEPIALFKPCSKGQKDEAMQIRRLQLIGQS